MSEFPTHHLRFVSSAIVLVPCQNSQYRGSPTSTISTSTISTSTIFIAIDIKSELVEFSRIGYVVKFVLVEITM